ncbi:hypothetical protein ACJMK2_006979 [Sinanodonta woodiana]|uniref:Uncharacterized protein n=1 Tax=Sinanodonta woodiana TaxID=1069815 RepID=A0ABD3VIJ9_SINWO
MTQDTLALAADIVPEPALKALCGLGLRNANNWSLRATGRRTTLLLVWDKEEKQENRGNLEFKRIRGRRRQPQRDNQRAAAPPPTLPPKVSEELAKPSETDIPLIGTITGLQKRIERLSNRLDSIFEPEYLEELDPDTSQILSATPAVIPEKMDPKPKSTPPPPRTYTATKGHEGI